MWLPGKKADGQFTGPVQTGELGDSEGFGRKDLKVGMKVSLWRRGNQEFRNFVNFAALPRTLVDPTGTLSIVTCL